MATPGNKMSGNAAYRVHIPLYEGPLDLLLDLIKKQEMNIHDIQISLITAQYLEYLHKLEELNVDVSADFIYMAATLIYIKSKMLLPPDPLAAEEGAEGDPRAELVQPLTRSTARAIRFLSSRSGTADRSRFVRSSEPCSGRNFCDGKSHVSVFASAYRWKLPGSVGDPPTLELRTLILPGRSPS